MEGADLSPGFFGSGGVIGEAGVTGVGSILGGGSETVGGGSAGDGWADGCVCVGVVFGSSGMRIKIISYLYLH